MKGAYLTHVNGQRGGFRCSRRSLWLCYTSAKRDTWGRLGQGWSVTAFQTLGISFCRATRLAFMLWNVHGFLNPSCQTLQENGMLGPPAAALPSGAINSQHCLSRAAMNSLWTLIEAIIKTLPWKSYWQELECRLMDGGGGVGERGGGARRFD